MSDGIVLGAITDMAGETYEVYTYPQDTAFCPAGSVFIRSEFGGGPMLDPQALGQLRELLDRVAAPGLPWDADDDEDELRF